MHVRPEVEVEVRWKVLLGAVAAGVIVTAVLLLVAPAPTVRAPDPTADPIADPTAAADPAIRADAASRVNLAPAVERSDAASLATADKRLPGTWVDQAPPDAAASGPLVIGLHGRGDTPEHFSGLAGRIGPRFAWRFLQAPLPWRENTQWFRMDASDGGRADLDQAMALVDVHVRSGGARKVALVGFSQGCFVAAHYAAFHPERIAAVVCAGGGLAYSPPELAPGPRPAVLFFHGSEDAVVPISRARDAKQQLENRGLACELIVHAEGHSLPEAELPRLRQWLERQLGAPTAEPAKPPAP